MDNDIKQLMSYFVMLAATQAISPELIPQDLLEKVTDAIAFNRDALIEQVANWNSLINSVNERDFIRSITILTEMDKTMQNIRKGMNNESL